MSLENIPIEKIQRLILIVDFVFTALSYKIATSYKLFNKLTAFIGELKFYILLTPNQIALNFTNKYSKEKREIKLPTLLIFTIGTSILFVFYPDILWSIMTFPIAMWKFGVNIWCGTHHLWLYFIFPFVSFLLFIIGLFLLMYIWGFIILGNLKTVSILFHYISTKLNQKVFEILVFIIFVLGWVVTFLLTYR